MNRYQSADYGWAALIALMAWILAFLGPMSMANAQTWLPYTEPGNNVTSFLSAFQYASDATGGMFGLLLSMSIFVVSFIMTRAREEFSDAMLVSSFISFVLSVFLKILNLTADWVVGLFAFTIVVSVILSAKNWIRG